MPCLGSLKNLLDDETVPVPQIDSESVIRAFFPQRGLPEFLRSQYQPLDIARPETWFSERLFA